MIDYYEVLPLLAEACSTFVDSRTQRGESGDDGEFVEIGRFAAHVIDLLDRGEGDSFAAVFAVVERVLAEGDADARSLVTAGLLDDLTNPESYPGSAGPADLLKWSGSRARQHPSVRSALRREP